MSFIAAAFWLATAIVGGYMLSRTMNGSRNAAGATVTDLPVLLSFLHPALALVGLALLGAYVFTQETWFAWLAVVALILVAAGGGLLFGKWMKARRAWSSSSSSPVRRFTAEQSIPVEVVALHGLLALGTIVVVVVVALQA